MLGMPLLYLSHYLKAHRIEYYDRLMAVRNDGDWEGWLRFFLLGVRDTAAARAVAQLQKFSIPREVRSARRNRLFQYAHYLALFQDDGEPATGAALVDPDVTLSR
ncbi:MAG TPA: hypothetical protein VN837_03720 [Chloroflexota bacterium]|nr:hypothetical protein [Chloroflexota bacterium]